MKWGIYSPSAGTSSQFPRRFARGLRWMEEQGWTPMVGGHARGQKGYLSGSVEERLSDIEVLLEQGADVLIATLGGYNSNQLLEKLPYEALGRRRPVLCGYSDVTAILLAAATLTDCPCLYGPTFLPELCEYPQPAPETVACLREILAGRPYRYQPLPTVVDEFIDWREEERGACRVKRRRAAPGWVTLKEGCAAGPLWGGNLQTLLPLVGTKYFPLSQLSGAILFLEDLEERPAVLDAMLQGLQLRGCFAAVSGVILGDFPAGEARDTVHRLVLSYVGRREIPVLADVEIGHRSPMVTVPIGRRAVLRLRGGSQYWAVEGAAGTQGG